MRTWLIVVIFLGGLLTLYAAYKYAGEIPILKYAVYIVVFIIFVVILLDLAGLLPATNWNRKI